MSWPDCRLVCSQSINGIQYHLQISKAHFALAINKTVLGTPAAERQGSCSSTGEECQSPSPTDAADESVPSGVSRKKHPCPHPGCPKVYKQAAGLKYHLAHVREHFFHPLGNKFYYFLVLCSRAIQPPGRRSFPTSLQCCTSACSRGQRRLHSNHVSF